MMARKRPDGGERRPAAFLDRDGTIIEEKEYLSEPDGVALIAGAAEGLRLLRDAGLALVVVTNQSGIARGLYTLADYQAVARRLDEVLADEGVHLDGTRFCPHHPDETGPCSCRKPATGMYRSAASDLGLDPARSYFIGDRASDVLPSRELGGQGILVRTGFGAGEEAAMGQEFPVVDDLLGAAEWILASGPEFARQRRGKTGRRGLLRTP
jgi:D-glycero-D-manno-heptose 1,7-bisphosphate phosphatase